MSRSYFSTLKISSPREKLNSKIEGKKKPSEDHRTRPQNSLRFWHNHGRQSHLKTGCVMGPGLKTGCVMGPGLKNGCVVGPKNSTDEGT